MIETYTVVVLSVVSGIAIGYMAAKSTNTPKIPKPASTDDSSNDSKETPSRKRAASNGDGKECGPSKKKMKHEITIGKIKYYDSDVIGCGSTATIYGGRFEDHTRLAVKRIPVREKDALKTLKNVDEILSSSREIQVHKHTDSYHKHIVRYFCSEIEKAGPNCYVLIGLERCDGTLVRYIERREAYDLTPLDIMVQLAKGLTFLHGRGILHRDLKPKNILLKGNVVKLSDFSMAKFKRENDDAVLGDMFSISNEFGTPGWTAPEAFVKFSQNESNNASVTAACDIFALALIFYYVCSGGKFVYADQDSIQNNNGDLSGINTDYSLRKLVYSMIRRDPKRRPKAAAISKHPALWTSKKVLDFYNATSNLLMNNAHGATHSQLDLAGNDIHDGDWHRKLTPEFKTIIIVNPADPSRRKRQMPLYNPNSALSLIRLIRNNHQHYFTLPEGVRKELGSLPDGYSYYFKMKFPKLLMKTFWAMKTHSTVEALKEFY